MLLGKLGKPSPPDLGDSLPAKSGGWELKKLKLLDCGLCGLFFFFFFFRLWDLGFLRVGGARVVVVVEVVVRVANSWNLWCSGTNSS